MLNGLDITSGLLADKTKFNLNQLIYRYKDYGNSDISADNIEILHKAGFICYAPNNFKDFKYLNSEDIVFYTKEALHSFARCIESNV